MTVANTRYMGDLVTLWSTSVVLTGPGQRTYAALSPDFGGGSSGGGGGTPVPQVPTTGQIWPRAKTIATGGGSAWTRETVTITTASLNAAEQEAGTVHLAPGFRLYAITTDVSARVRLYTDAAKRDADAARLISTPPGADIGLVLDYLTTYDFKGGDLSPLVDGFDGKATPDGVIPYLIDNMESVPNPVTVTLTFLRTE